MATITNHYVHIKILWLVLGTFSIFTIKYSAADK